MTIIVKHIKTENEYLLIGTGIGDKALNLPFLRGNFWPEKEQEDIYLVTLCDREGNIFWLSSTEIIVTEIDGKPPSELLADRVTVPSTELLNEKQESKENEKQEKEEDFGDEGDEDWL